MLHKSIRWPVISTLSHIANGAIRIPIVRLWSELVFETQESITPIQQCLFDSGAPVGVIPFSVHQNLGIVWQALPGPWAAALTTWQGVECDIGMAQVWLPLDEPPFLHGPLSFVAKFVRSTPSNLPGAIPILLGLNLIAQHLAHWQ